MALVRIKSSVWMKWKLETTFVFLLIQQMLGVDPGPILPDIYLEEVIWGVVYQHDESSSTDVVNAPREADEQDGRYVVNNLLLEVLKKVTHSQVVQLLKT